MPGSSETGRVKSPVSRQRRQTASAIQSVYRRGSARGWVYQKRM
jgi:hypothetical protein